MTTGEHAPPPPEEDVVSLVGALEACWEDPGEATVQSLSRLLARRQRILTALQEADTTGLDPATRRDVAERLQRVRDRNEVLLDACRGRRERAREGLAGLVKGRAALRGYQRGGAVTTGVRPGRSA